MKKIIFAAIFTFALLLIFNKNVFAQGMMNFTSSPADNSAIQSQQKEEQEGKNFLDELNNKSISCSSLTDDNFEKIGEYFMGLAIGDTSRHIAMNEMMKLMMGEQGEEQMHIVWGKQSSGCQNSAALPSQNYFPMMQMIGLGQNHGINGNQNLPWWTNFQLFTILILQFVWLVAGILSIIWLWKRIIKNK